MSTPIEFQERLHSASRFPHVAGWVDALDPAATKPTLMHPGVFWIDTSAGTPPWSVKVRNANNDGWEDVGSTGTMLFGTFAARPAPSHNGTLYAALDVGRMYVDDSASWIEIYTRPLNRWEPLTNGDPVTPELIFVGGDVVMIEVPI